MAGHAWYPVSSIEKKNLNYLSTVEKFFVSLKDSGVTLSSNDYNLITQWEERGVPVRVVCRAIEKGFSRMEKNGPGSGRRISLSTMRSYIEEEIKGSNF